MIKQDRRKERKIMSSQSEMIKKQLFEANLEIQLEDDAKRLFGKSRSLLLRLRLKLLSPRLKQIRLLTMLR